MGGSRYKPLNSSTIKNILTLRYNPTKKTLLPKLTWKDFVERRVSNPVNFVEKSIENTIRNDIGESRKRISIALSGGVDSALVLALLRKTLPDTTIEAISVKFADSVDESVQATKLAEKYESNHHIIYLSNYFIELPKAISIVGLPFWDLHWYHVVKKAKSISDLLMSGDGGDELFGGYTFRYKKFLSLIRPNSSPLEKVKAYLTCHERDWVPDQEKLFGKKAGFSWKKIYSLLMPYFNNSLLPISQIFLADFNGKLLYNWLPLYTKFHKYFRIKYIAPILSKDIIKYATHIPHNLKYDYQTNTGKLVLRKLLGKYKIEKLVPETKQGFSVSTLNLWKSYGRKLCDYYLSDSRVVKEGWINPTWIKSHIGRKDDDLDVRYVNKFLGLLALEIWFRLFITNEMKPETRLRI